MVSFEKRDVYTDEQIRTERGREVAYRWTLASRIVGGIALGLAIPTTAFVVMDLIAKVKWDRSNGVALLPSFSSDAGMLTVQGRF